MKKITILLFGLLTISTLAQSINGEAIYAKKAVVNDSIKKSNSLESMIMNKVYKIMNTLEYTLTFNNYNSIFEIIDTNIDGDNYWRLAATSSDGGGIYYDDIKNNKIVRKLDQFGETFLISSGRNDYDWTLFPNETKLIGKYLCYKAECEEVSISKNYTFKITAWYCPLIPVSTGPVGFTGLPGLILELNHNNIDIYTLKEINFNDKKMNFNIPKKGKKVTKLEFEDILFKFMESRRN